MRTLFMSDIPSHGITCGGRCGHSFTDGEPYVQMLTVEARPHPFTGELLDCYLIYCPDCAGKVAS